MNDAHILLVEDDRKLGALLREFLEGNGFSVDLVDRGLEVEGAVTRGGVNLIVLDWMLPDIEGIVVCRRIRPVYSGPILMLTARHGDAAEVKALEVGADDYLAKPVRPGVLLARIRALLRRANATDEVEREQSPVPDRSGGRFQAGELVIEPQKRQVTMGKRTVELTTAEYELLWLLAKNAGQVLSRDELYLALRGVPFDGLDRSIDLRTSRIRTKLGDDPRGRGLIKTVRGVGYMMVR